IPGAAAVSEAINKAVNALDIRHDVSPTDRRVSVSVGGATCNQTTGHDLEELIKSAARALYKANRSGRNRALVDEVAPHRTLLIVDPHHAAPQRLSLLLQSRCNILTTESTSEAVEIAKDLHPDVIVIDAALADANDYQIFR